MYAPTFVPLAPLTITVTFTVPTACAGAVTVIVVGVAFVTVAGVFPNMTFVLPATKPIPVIVTGDPPVFDPLVALRRRVRLSIAS